MKNSNHQNDKRIYNAARNLTNSVPQTAATTFVFSSVFILLLCSSHYMPTLLYSITPLTLPPLWVTVVNLGLIFMNICFYLHLFSLLQFCRILLIDFSKNIANYIRVRYLVPMGNKCFHFKNACNLVNLLM